MLKIAASLWLLFSFVLSVNVALADSDPSLHQVYAAVQAGRLNEAQSMMNQVLRDHPNSAKAHYVDAEILAQGGQYGAAANELANAERLQPGLSFVKPESLQALKSKIASQTSVKYSTQKQSSFPWGMVILGLASIVIITLIMRAMTRRSYSGYPTGAQPIYGQQPFGAQPYGPVQGGGMGSTILGGLATGAAVGAGMVAGEALAHHFMDGNSGSGVAQMPTVDTSAAPDLGGNDFGIADGSSWDDNSSFVDSGSSDWT